MPLPWKRASTPEPSLRRGLLCLPPLLLASALGLGPARLGPASQDAGPGSTAPEARIDDGRTSRLEDVSASACVGCHAPVLEEWRESAHALAWKDERYQKALSKVRREESCTGCHIPEPLSSSLPLAPGASTRTTRPRARDEHKQLGVSCSACHLAADGATVLGPFGLETDAHPTRRDPRFEVETASATCLPCHSTTIGPVIGVGKDFIASDQEGLGLSCTECHMPPIRRPIASDPEGQITYPERRGRSHRILGPRDPAFLRRAFSLEVEGTAQGSATLVVTNRAGHRVPGMTERRFVFRARLVDAHGTLLDEGELVLDTRAYLPVEGTRQLTLSGRGAARIEVDARHEATGLGRGGHVFLTDVLALD